VEPTQQWASALLWLFDCMPAKASSIKNPLAVGARWYPDASDAKFAQREAEDLERGYLSDYQGVRKGLARLALSRNSKLLDKLLASNDPAFRSAAYAEGKLTSEQLSEAYDKDGELLFNEALPNCWIWRKAAGREALREIAWAVARHDKNSDLMAPNSYNRLCENMAKKHPDWFKDEEDEQAVSDENKEPVTKADLRAVVEGVDRSFRKLSTRVLWVWWFSVGALLVVSLRHF
jgi:hypothetical protein